MVLMTHISSKINTTRLSRSEKLQPLFIGLFTIFLLSLVAFAIFIQGQTKHQNSSNNHFIGIVFR